MAIVNGAVIEASHIWSEGTSFPGSPVDGQTFYRSDEDQVYRFYNSEWHQAAASTIWDDF